MGTEFICGCRGLRKAVDKYCLHFPVLYLSSTIPQRLFKKERNLSVNRLFEHLSYLSCRLTKTLFRKFQSSRSNHFLGLSQITGKKQIVRNQSFKFMSTCECLCCGLHMLPLSLSSVSKRLCAIAALECRCRIISYKDVAHGVFHGNSMQFAGVSSACET